MPPLNTSALSTAYHVTTLVADAPGNLNMSAPASSRGPTYLLAVRASHAWLARAKMLLGQYRLCETACYLVDRAKDLSLEQAIDMLQVTPARPPPSGWMTRGKRDWEPTFSHLRAWAHMVSSHLGSPLGIFIEDDLELWVPPHTLHLGLAACEVGTASVPSIAICYFGGCWGISAASGCQWNGAPPQGCPDRENRTLGRLADGSQLMGLQRFWPVKTGMMANRCVGFYVLSQLGALRLLLTSRDVADWVHPTDHHINSLAWHDRTLRVSFIEPPMGCQVGEL
jgi:hypothetical protein